MQIELPRNNVYQSVELLLLVPMLSLLAIPKCLLIFKENLYYTSNNMSSRGSVYIHDFYSTVIIICFHVKCVNPEDLSSAT